MIVYFRDGEMNMKMRHIQELPTPEELKAAFPLSEEIRRIKAKRDQEI